MFADVTVRRSWLDQPARPVLEYYNVVGLFTRYEGVTSIMVLSRQRPAQLRGTKQGIPVSKKRLQGFHVFQDLLGS